MFKIVFVVLAMTSLTPALASPRPVIVAPAVVTSSSSQYFHRQHNALVTPLIAQPIATPVAVEPVARTPVAPQPAPRTPEEAENPLAETFGPLRKEAAIVAAPGTSNVAAPSASYVAGRSASYVAAPRASYVAAPSAAYVAAPSAAYVAAPSAAYVSAPVYNPLIAPYYTNQVFV